MARHSALLAQPGNGSAPPGALEADVHLQAILDLTASNNRVADEMEYQRRRQQRFGEELHLASIGLPPITSASQTLTSADLNGPMDGKVWQLFTITEAGMTGGNINVYMGQAMNWNKIFTFLQDGIAGFSNMYLQRGDSLVFVSTSTFTGAAAITLRVAEFAEWLLPDYLL